MSELKDIVDNYLRRKQGEIQNEWDKHSEAAGNAFGRIESEETINGKEFIVKGRFIAFGMKMWTLEYGKGSLMDRKNPGLADYRASVYWNKMRTNENYTVRTRTEDYYYDLDGTRHKGSGIKGRNGKGLNIENLNNWTIDEKYQVPVWRASHIIKEAFTKDNVITQDFKQDLLKAFGKKFVIGPIVDRTRTVWE